MGNHIFKQEIYLISFDMIPLFFRFVYFTDTRIRHVLMNVNFAAMNLCHLRLRGFGASDRICEKQIEGWIKVMNKQISMRFFIFKNVIFFPKCWVFFSLWTSHPMVESRSKTMKQKGKSKKFSVWMHLHHVSSDQQKTSETCWISAWRVQKCWTPWN